MYHILCLKHVLFCWSCPGNIPNVISPATTEEISLPVFLGEIPSGNHPGSQYTHVARAWPGWDEREEAPIMLLSLSLFPFQVVSFRVPAGICYGSPSPQPCNSVRKYCGLSLTYNVCHTLHVVYRVQKVMRNS